MQRSACVHDALVSKIHALERKKKNWLLLLPLMLEVSESSSGGRRGGVGGGLSALEKSYRKKES